VLAVVSTPDTRQAALPSGADHAILVDNWLDDVRELTDGRGVSAVADPVGGDRSRTPSGV